MANWQIVVLYTGAGLAIGLLLEIKQAVNKVQAQVEHLHNVMLAELDKR